MKLLGVEFTEYEQPPGPWGAPARLTQQITPDGDTVMEMSPQGVSVTHGEYGRLYPWSVIRSVAWKQ